MTFKTFLFGATLTVLSGCAAPIYAGLNADASPTLMKQKTASHFGTSQARVRISEFEKGVLGSSYQARVNGTFYNCRYYVGSVSCAKPGAGLF